MSGERARGKNLKDSTPPRDAPGQLASSLGAFCARCVRIRGVPRAGAFRTRGDSRALRASTAPAQHRFVMAARMPRAVCVGPPKKLSTLAPRRSSGAKKAWTRSIRKRERKRPPPMRPTRTRPEAQLLRPELSTVAEQPRPRRGPLRAPAWSSRGCVRASLPRRTRSVSARRPRRGGRGGRRSVRSRRLRRRRRGRQRKRRKRRRNRRRKRGGISRIIVTQAAAPTEPPLRQRASSSRRPLRLAAEAAGPPPWLRRAAVLADLQPRRALARRRLRLVVAVKTEPALLRPRRAVALAAAVELPWEAPR